MCNFLEYKGFFLFLSSFPPTPLLPSDSLFAYEFPEETDTKVVYRRYASLFFVAGIDSADNELITLEIVHRYVEHMDKYYGNVCELDIIFNFQKAYFILDELLIAGEMQESGRKGLLKYIAQQDTIEEIEGEEDVLGDLLGR